MLARHGRKVTYQISKCPCFDIKYVGSRPSQKTCSTEEIKDKVQELCFEGVFQKKRTIMSVAPTCIILYDVNSAHVLTLHVENIAFVTVHNKERILGINYKSSDEPVQFDFHAVHCKDDKLLQLLSRICSHLFRVASLEMLKAGNKKRLEKIRLMYREEGMDTLV